MTGKTIQIRLTDDQHARLKQMAIEAQMTMAALIKYLVLGKSLERK
jgi:predicted DNA-binding ribbon-helix-helix protein